MITLAQSAGMGLIYGTGTVLPPVPEGWKFIESEDDFLMLKSPEGDLYFAEHVDDRLIATRAKPNPNDDKMESKWVYCDTDRTILGSWPEKSK